MPGKPNGETCAWVGVLGILGDWIAQRVGAALLFSASLAAQNVITTIAGVDPTFNGSGQVATNVPIGYVNGVATDSAGNIYFTDPLEHLVLRVAAADGTLSVVAGNGIAGYSGDGGPASMAAIAALDSPAQYDGTAAPISLGGIAVDSQNNVYFGDGHYVRAVSPNGIISTIAGGGAARADNLPATQAAIGVVTGLALDSAGNLYFCETNQIRVLSPSSGILRTYAGSGPNGYAGDSGPATKALLSQPTGLAFDRQGNLYVTDGDVLNYPARIRRITPQGIISTIAGGGAQQPANGVAPLSLNLGFASGVAVDSSGEVYVFAPGSGYLLKFSGSVTTLVTSTIPSVFTTSVPASSAYLTGHRNADNSGIALDSAGNLYVADSRDGHVCKIDTKGFLTTVAGNGTYAYGGDAGPARDAYIQGPAAMTQTPDGTIYFLDTLNARVRSISLAGVINTVLSPLNYPPLGNVEVLSGLVSDPAGNIYVLLLHRLIEIAPNGNQTFIIFGGSNNSDGAPAISANIQIAGGLARDANGNFYVSDTAGNMIYKITPDRKIHPIAGNGTPAVSPDGSVALSSPVSNPSTLLADSSGGLYFVEQQQNGLASNTVRHITADGHLRTIAGNGTPGFSGDGRLAIQANLSMLKRAGLALDLSGNLYLADSLNGRVRMVTPGGGIDTFAGNGALISAGDGGPARQASLIVPRGLLFDSKGNLLIADMAANRIRSVLAAPPAVSTAPGSFSFSGRAGGALTPPQQITISSPVNGLGFSVTVTSGADWLVLGATSGVTPQQVELRADPSNLTPGTYQATLNIGVINGTPLNTSATVMFQVLPGGNPKLAADGAALTFTFPSRPTGSLTQQLRVSNGGTGSLAFSANAATASGGSWLAVAPASGSATPNTAAVLAVTANPAGLDVGTYSGTITISSSTSGETIIVPVTMTVSTASQVIQLSRPALSFTAVALGGVVPAHSFAVKNLGRGDMNFSVSTKTLAGGPQWLSATPSSGDSTPGSPSTVTVNVDQNGLAPGFYYGVVRIDSAGAANSPQVATVALRVLPAGQDPGPTIQPSQVIFHTVQGAPSPGSTELLVYNLSGSELSYVSSIVASNPANQFSLAPATGTLSPSQPTRLVLQPATTTLAAGVYNAEVTLQFSDGTIRRAGLRTIVAPVPASASAISAGVEPRAAAACTPTQLVPIITSLGQSFGVPAAWPVVLASEVRDDCGNTLDNGSVKVSFSNGDPPLSLLPVQSGIWQSTWQAGNTSGPVTLTVNASNSAQTLTGTVHVTGGLGNPSPAPILNSAVSGASFAGNVALAPGSIISLFGQNLANGIAPATAVPLSTTLAGASVIMAGVELPLLYGSSGQVNAVVSSGININTSQQILVQRDNTYSIPIPVNVAASEPAVFGYPAPGDPATQGAIVNAVSYAVADPSAPVTAGDVLAIYCTGLGAVAPAVPDGTAAPSSTLAYTVATPVVTVGGQPAKVFYSGLSPGFVGLYQIDAYVPSGVTPGGQVPVVVSIAGQTSPAVTIAVK